MLNIQQEVSIEGRITQFEMEYIKSKLLFQTKEGSQNTRDSHVRKKFSKLKSEQIQFLKKKVKQIQNLQSLMDQNYKQKILLLETHLQKQNNQLSQIKSQIFDYRKQLKQFTKDIRTVTNYLAVKVQMKRPSVSIRKHQIRKSYSPGITNHKQQKKQPNAKLQPKLHLRKINSQSNLNDIIYTTRKQKCVSKNEHKK